MNTSKKLLILALAAPIVALLILTGYKHMRMSTGTEVVLPIRGYDPRDLLSGHYLVYQVDYGTQNICRAGPRAMSGPAWLCLDNRTMTTTRPVACGTVVRGHCNGSRFMAGIERYYVPEAEAGQLDRLIRKGQASIKISVSADGTTRVKDLLIDGTPWRDL